MADEDIGALVVRIEANLKNFESGMNNITDKVDSFGSKIKKLGGIIAGAFAVKVVGDFFASTIKDAAEAEDNLKQLETVIVSTGGKAGVTADQITSMAAELQNVTKFSDDAIIAGDNLLLTFTNIGKDVFPEATETMLNMSQALKQDLKGSAIQLGKALNDPIKGITALSRVGVSFTESQKEMIAKLVETGDIVGAQKVILAELNTEFGNAARAAGETFSGKLERLKNQFGEIKESIGNALLPVLSNLEEWFINKMPAIQEFVTTAFTNIANVITPIYEIIMPLLQQEFQQFSDNILPLFNGKINETNNNLLPLIDAFNNLVDTVLPPLQHIFEVFTSEVLPELSAAYMSWVTNVYPIIVDAFNYIVNNVLPPIIEEIEFLATEIIPLLAAKFQEWIPVITKIVQFLWEVIKLHLDNIMKLFQLVWPIAKETVTIAVNTIVNVIDGLMKTLNGVIDFINGVFTGNWETAWNGIKSIYVGIWESLSSVVKGVLNEIISLTNTAIRGINKLQINVPDWVTETTGIKDFGLNIPEIPKLATGTNFVPFDTMAFIHKGEAVIPANNNPSNPNANNPVGQSYNYERMFEGAQFIIRSDKDIKMLAREFYNITQGKNRGSGVVAAT